MHFIYSQNSLFLNIDYTQLKQTNTVCKTHMVNSEPVLKVNRHTI